MKVQYIWKWHTLVKINWQEKERIKEKEIIEIDEKKLSYYTSNAFILVKEEPKKETKKEEPKKDTKK